MTKLSKKHKRVVIVVLCMVIIPLLVWGIPKLFQIYMFRATNTIEFNDGVYYYEGVAVPFADGQIDKITVTLATSTRAEYNSRQGVNMVRNSCNNKYYTMEMCVRFVGTSDMVLLNCIACKSGPHNFYDLTITHGEQQFVVNTAFALGGEQMAVMATCPIVDGTTDLDRYQETNIELMFKK